LSSSVELCKRGVSGGKKGGFMLKFREGPRREKGDLPTGGFQKGAITMVLKEWIYKT